MTLTILFLIVAILYSTIGLGGGSTYIALMFLWHVPIETLPTLALLCNLSVVSINLLRYTKKSFPTTTLLPLISTSIPMAYMGGQISLSTTGFQGLLGVVLLFSGLSMSIGKHFQLTHDSWTWVHSMVIGSVLGFIAGCVGIGGGIFLIPILHAYRMGTPSEIAQVTSGFIFCNSLAGLMGHASIFPQISWLTYGSLNIAVILGAIIGTQLHLKILKRQQVRWITIFLIEFVAFRILWLTWSNY